MRWTAALVLLAYPTFTNTANGQAAARDGLPWLVGCWRMETPTRVVEEMWMPARGGVMLGIGRTVRLGTPARADSVTSFEFVRLYARSDTLVFAAAPSGQPPSEFVNTKRSADEAVFENPAHDFPQRVIYKSISADSLQARVEGSIGGGERSQAFGYRRVACSGT